MKKFILVPEDLYNSLMTKSSTIDEFSENLLSDALTNTQRTPYERHAIYNDRLPGYLDYKKRKRNMPTRVILEKPDDGSQKSYDEQDHTSRKRHKQTPKNSSLKFETARASIHPRKLFSNPDLEDFEQDNGHDSLESRTKGLDETFVVSPHARLEPRSIHRSLKRALGSPSSSDSSDEEDDTLDQPNSPDPTEEHVLEGLEPNKEISPTIWSQSTKGKTPRRPQGDDNVQPRALQFGPEKVKEKEAKKPEVMTREEAYKWLRKTVSQNKAAFKVGDRGQVLYSSDAPIQGSHFDNVLLKYKNKSLENVRGEQPFRKTLLKHPATAEVAKQFFTHSPMILKTGKVLPRQKGKGTLKLAQHVGRYKDRFRFAIRNWRRV